MKKFNIVLLSDSTSELFLQRTLGVHKSASELRSNGFDGQVGSHLHVFSVEEIQRILTHLVNDKTLFVGFSTFFYRGVEDVTDLTENWEKGGVRYGPKQLGSFLPHGLKYNKQIKNLIRSKNANCKLVLGGPDANDSAYIKDYDYTVVGYADLAVVNLARHLANGDKLLNARRSIHHSIIIDDFKAEGYDFANTPMFYDHSDAIMPQEVLPIEIGRGCIFKCTFCSYPLNGKKKNDHVKLEAVLTQELLDNYIEMAESELGELILRDWEFEETGETTNNPLGEDNEKLYRLVDKDTPEEKEHNRKVFDRAREIEKQEWDELFKILKGQDYTTFDKDKDWDEQFDGSGIKGWWD